MWENVVRRIDQKLNVADPPDGIVPPDQLSCTDVAANVEKTDDVGDGSRVGHEIGKRNFRNYKSTTRKEIDGLAPLPF